ncbi:DUF2384 domain-containing protein (plasmid) [Pseudomonas cannabina pv. alisalensis]|uniref:DUF2384 domain-containing protein n=1 Tax=Pseudomonas syringae pv. maculicola str. ES4326 TaxID=629265 RepID=A0A8T8CBC7_PSEYM|nr:MULTISPECIES: antitoxin Xre/MbcA/ParS toxin-binding domain-containing protein [Pseudomonas syringae group]QHF00514.1 DUF2384 domain-containing protein [Pseudomonas syringae pv. maculicola str. ES4326]QHF00681.1 DUF2384 domain-containing protein [Pseudomonas syringae pv. maculicola str. ES4326]UBZ00288.1 DUF2384 domain-containing protein [Pseudomonas cannabina pv. alisalensis]UBZ00493.1 DUF2384 domain-containing protein [Pseudomonas cannabina pv. alisalensis]
MFTDARRKDTYGTYRARLQTFLHIPIDASDQDIHQLIESGFSADTVWRFCDAANLSPTNRDQIITVETLKTRLAHDQPLTSQESDRLYRFARVTAMAESIFGSDEKAMQWLSKPKDRFSGKSPLSMLTTTQGASQVEEMLIQLAEGFAF